MRAIYETCHYGVGIRVRDICREQLSSALHMTSDAIDKQQATKIMVLQIGEAIMQEEPRP